MALLTEQRTEESKSVGSALVWISLCNLCVLCVSVVNEFVEEITTETPRTQRLHREELKLGHY